MGYLPGPLILQDAGHVGIATTETAFADDVADQLGELDTIHGSWAPFLKDAASLLAESSNPFPDVDVDGAQLAVHAYSDPEALLGLNALLTAYSDSEKGLGSALAYAPAESWRDSVAPFAAPTPAETLGVPVIPDGFLNFTVSGTVAGSTSPPSAADNPPAGVAFVPAPGPTPITGPGTTLIGPKATLINLTQYGNPNFKVGDQWQGTATAKAGQRVYVYATFNGNDFGGGYVGDIGAFGSFVMTGVMGQDRVGVWEEQWFVESNQVATFSYVVVDS